MYHKMGRGIMSIQKIYERLGIWVTIMQNEKRLIGFNITGITGSSQVIQILMNICEELVKWIVNYRRIEYIKSVESK